MIRQVLDSCHISFEEIDVSDPAFSDQKTFMWQNGTPKGNQAKPVPPQVFNDDQYCGVFFIHIFMLSLQSSPIQLFT